MRSTQMMISAGIICLCCMRSSGASKADFICIHPVPLTIKELVEKQKSGLISEELLEKNTEYLVLKYCAATDEAIQAVASVALGDGCEMKWGYRLGELVYWASCSAIDQGSKPDQGSTSDQAESKKTKPKQLSAAQHLRNCLADYVRRKGNFVPEGQSTAYVKSLSDMTSMCQFAIAHRNYYWEYLAKHPELGR